VKEVHQHQRQAGARHRYRQLSLVALLGHIVQDADREALLELHDHRTSFRWEGGAGLLLVDFVERIRAAAAPTAGRVLVDVAYSLTVDKFSNLPRAAGNGDGPGRGLAGPDCRNYFRPVLKLLAEQLTERRKLSVLTEEGLAARLLQRLVTRHFYLSLQESRRQGPMTRYLWRMPTGELTVLMPRSIVGRARARWLEGNIVDPDPRRPGERQRVQTVIDELLGNGSVPAWTLAEADNADRWWGGAASADPAPGLRAISVDGLAKSVADEKVETIYAQRPAIRALGADRLRALIQQIFADLSGGCCADGRIARAYGLTKATFSRFAGSRWGAATNQGTNNVPDLWRNTASVLASDPAFVEVAEGFGLWPRVREIAELPRGRHSGGGA